MAAPTALCAHWTARVTALRRGLTSAFVPPISGVRARDKERYPRGLTVFREDRLADWIELAAPQLLRPPASRRATRSASPTF